MFATIAASSLSQAEVEENLNLIEVLAGNFFTELKSPLPELDELTESWLDKIQADFLSLRKQNFPEGVVQILVLPHLLAAANLSALPFYPNIQESVEIELPHDPRSDEVGMSIRGRIDCFVLHSQLWAIVVESKRSQLNVRMGLAQALIHMMASPNDNQPTYGLVINGSDCMFVKLLKGNPNQYALSPLFSMERSGHRIHNAVQILRKLRSIVLGEPQ